MAPVFSVQERENSVLIGLKGDGSQFPCAEGQDSLTSDLVEIPLMSVQVCTQQTQGPIIKYLLSLRVFG